MNTYLIEFHNMYQEEDESMDFSFMNSMRHTMGDGEVQHIYDSHELHRQLAELAFTRIIKPYPEEQDIQEYARYFEASLNGEVEGQDGTE